MPVCKHCLWEAPRPNALAAHLGSNRCLLRQVKQKFPRKKWPRGVAQQGNLQRTLSAKLQVFKTYLKANLMRQIQQKRGPLLFSPLCSSRAAADVQGIANVIKRAARASDGNNKTVRMLAASFAAGLAWTCNFSNVVGLPPAKWSQAYEQQLRKRLVSTKSRGKEIVNMAIKCMPSRSLLPCSSDSATKSKVDYFVGAVGAVRSIVELASEAADKLPDVAEVLRIFGKVGGLRKDGYMVSLSLGVACSLRLVTPEACESVVRLPMGNGTPEGVAELTGDCMKNLQSCRALVVLRIRLILKTLQKIWSKKGLTGRPTGLSSLDVRTQLCQWKRDRFGETVGDLRIIRCALCR